MKKNSFYIFQEELICYKPCKDIVTISGFVEELNRAFGKEGMKRLRSSPFIDYLMNRGFLEMVNGEIRPTRKGELLGISIKELSDKEGYRHCLNVYDRKAQQYLLDHLYDVLDDY